MGTAAPTEPPVSNESPCAGLSKKECNATPTGEKRNNGKDIMCKFVAKSSCDDPTNPFEPETCSELDEFGKTACKKLSVAEGVCIWDNKTKCQSALDPKNGSKC